MSAEGIYCHTRVPPYPFAYIKLSIFVRRCVRVASMPMAEWLHVTFLLFGLGTAVVAAVAFSIFLNNTKRKQIATERVRADR